MPTRIYVKDVLPLMHQGHVKAFCHITGGGLMENLPRVLPGNLKAQIDAGLWSVPPVFGWLAHKVRIKQALQILNLCTYELSFAKLLKLHVHFTLSREKQRFFFYFGKNDIQWFYL